MKFALLVLALLAVSFTATAADRPSTLSDDMSFCTPLDSFFALGDPGGGRHALNRAVEVATPTVSENALSSDDLGLLDERRDEPDTDELVQNCEIAYVFVLNEAERTRPERYGSTSPSPLTDHSPNPTALHSRGSIRDLRHGPTAAS